MQRQASTGTHRGSICVCVCERERERERERALGDVLELFLAALRRVLEQRPPRRHHVALVEHSPRLLGGAALVDSIADEGLQALLLHADVREAVQRSEELELVGLRARACRTCLQATCRLEHCSDTASSSSPALRRSAHPD